jgi:putative oxidoreductase
MNSNAEDPLIDRAYRLLAAAGTWMQTPLLLAIRLYWGWQFFQDGKGKLMNLSKVTEYFQGWHVPFPMFSVCLTGTIQIVCGLMLLLGLAARLASVPLILVMIGAYLTAEIDKVKHIFSDPDKFVTADPFLFMLAALIVFAFGPGKISLDCLIAGKPHDDSES